MGVPKSLVRLVVFCYNGFNRPIGIEPITSCLELEPFLEARAVFIVILVLTIAFWAAFFFPQLFTYLGLDAWQTSNTTFIGLGFIITSLILIIALFIIITNWISSKARTKRNTREFQDLLDNLTPSELIYL